MNPIQQAVSSLRGMFSPKQPSITSPIPSYNALTDPGLLNYYQQNQAQEQLAAQSPAVAPTPIPAQLPSGANPYETQAAQIFSQMGIPPAVGIGIWAAEGRGKTINPNNPFNIGAYDSNPTNANAYGFQSPLEGTQEAAKFLAGKSDYMASDKKKIVQQALNEYKKTNDQAAYLKAIAPLYSSNKKYVSLVESTPEFQRWAGNTQ